MTLTKKQMIAAALRCNAIERAKQAARELAAKPYVS